MTGGWTEVRVTLRSLDKILDFFDILSVHCHVFRFLIYLRITKLNLSEGRSQLGRLNNKKRSPRKTCS
jgi:hypothetical protein